MQHTANVGKTLLVLLMQYHFGKFEPLFLSDYRKLEGVGLTISVSSDDYVINIVQGKVRVR